jgi:hypothetical protein
MVIADASGIAPTTRNSLPGPENAKQRAPLSVVPEFLIMRRCERSLEQTRHILSLGGERSRFPHSWPSPWSARPAGSRPFVPPIPSHPLAPPPQRRLMGSPYRRRWRKRAPNETRPDFAEQMAALPSRSGHIPADFSGKLRPAG